MNVAFDSVDLPDFLVRVWAAVDGRPRIGVDGAAVAERRRAHVARVQSEVPGVIVESDGQTVYTRALSVGCRTCKDGAWDCVFITMRCNLQCGFCCSTQSTRLETVVSAYGDDVDGVAENYDRVDVRGVGFSGGEALLEPERLFAWIAALRARGPHRYFWVYTNGVLADRERLLRLADLGVNEIRFNMAATGYTNPTTLRNVRAAVQLFPVVTVEIPAIPEHEAQLLAALDVWVDHGVRQLNLHELMREPGSNSCRLPGEFEAAVLDDGHRTDGSLASRRLALAVMRAAQARRLLLAVNDCSLESKRLQLRGRRRALAGLVAGPHELRVGDELLETCCAFRNRHEFCFVHPDSLVTSRAALRDHAFVRLRRTVPLSLKDKGTWVHFEPIP